MGGRRSVHEFSDKQKKKLKKLLTRSASSEMAGLSPSPARDAQLPADSSMNAACP
jgi:hypothetical protein